MMIGLTEFHQHEMSQLLQACDVDTDLSNTPLCALDSPVAMGDGTVFSEVRHPTLSVRLRNWPAPT